MATKHYCDWCNKEIFSTPYKKLFPSELYFLKKGKETMKMIFCDNCASKIENILNKLDKLSLG